MKFITTVAQKASMIAGRTGLKIKKYSPEILLATGTACIIGGVVLACQETLKVDEILEEAEEKKEIIRRAVESFDDYSEEDASKDNTKLTIKTGVKVVKNYIPAATLLLTGFVCIFSSYGIIHKRNVALTTAYSSLQQAYDKYRNRVKETIGDEKEKDIYYDRKELKVDKVNEDGSKSKAKVKMPGDKALEYSPYARFFDAGSTAWRKDPEYNLAFLTAQQSFANNLLHSRGHIFLNEVYDMLGLDRSQAGQMVGWVLGNGDDFVDFGIYNANSEANRAFINGYEDAILLDFNVDGPIYDKI